LTDAAVPDYELSDSYSGDGQRVRRDVTGSPETNAFRAVFDVNRGLPVVLQEEVDWTAAATTTIARRYVWGPGSGPAYVVEGTGSGTPSVLHADGLGSVRAQSDASAQVTRAVRYDEYGAPVGPREGGSPPGQPFRFTGEPWDYEVHPAGLVQLRARAYNPELGRFLQRDPIPGVLAVPLSLNRYAYVQNNPVSHTDPTGLKPLKARSVEEQQDRNCFDLASNHFCVVWQPVQPCPVCPAILTPVVIRDFGGGADDAAEGAGKSALKSRADEIHSLLDPVAQRFRTTAVVRARGADGAEVLVVASSNRVLAPAQKAGLRGGEIAAEGTGHAEVTALQTAKAMGLQPLEVAASRPICGPCAEAIRDAGAIPVSPLR
jgi:RHS repeat-associated protein